MSLGWTTPQNNADGLGFFTLNGEPHKIVVEDIQEFGPADDVTQAEFNGVLGRIVSTTDPAETGQLGYTTLGGDILPGLTEGKKNRFGYSPERKGWLYQDADTGKFYKSKLRADHRIFKIGGRRRHRSKKARKGRKSRKSKKSQN
jgi:hypothetical protein